MKILISTLLLVLLGFQTGCGQKPPAERPHCQNPDFDQKVSQMIRFSVPLIGVEELQNIQDEVLIFDAREKEEFEVSHIPGARFLGYRKAELEKLQELPKNKKIVLYCSIGYRSEKIGEKLQNAGFTNVYNLYGSLFEWTNQGLPLVDQNGNPTRQIHTFNAAWSKWVADEKAQKVW